MEAQGLPKPEYKQDSFILKAIIKNAGFASKNLGIAPQKTGNGPQKTGNDPQKTGFALKKREMVEIIEKSNYSPSIKTKLEKIIAEIAENQVLAAKDIKKILDCGATAATGMISRLNDLELLHKVTGKGPGHYILNLHSKDQNG
jgi:ATP-dependent DNA helicase RecG